MKIYDKNIALYFDITQQTLMNWKRSDSVNTNRRYKAYKHLYTLYINSLDAGQKENFKKNPKFFQKVLTNENIFDRITL